VGRVEEGRRPVWKKAGYEILLLMKCTKKAKIKGKTIEQ
jgi:hypothetical protein